MKRIATAILLVITSLFLFSTTALAQTATPPDGANLPEGFVNGKLINQSAGGSLPEKAELMVHIWDQNVEKGMYHGTSLPDGTFKIEKVPLMEGAEYLVMAVYKDVTYSSQSAIYKSGEEFNFKVPIKETTNDLSQAQVDQMHVLFKPAEDGMEIQEIYILSNNSDRTIKDAVKIDDGTQATFQFSLPKDADFIYFDPNQDSTRFVKFPGGFADKEPLQAGEKTGQFMVSYLIPFKEQRQFSYTARLNMKQVNFLVPAGVGVKLAGDDLSAPKSMTLQSGDEYDIYSIPELQMGRTVSLTISSVGGAKELGWAGSITSPAMRTGIVIGGGVLGLSLLIAGIWWAVKEKESVEKVNEDTDDTDDVETDFDAIVMKIARLDETNKSREITLEEYSEKRAVLMALARELLA
jgi:hypothetical protein